MPLQSSASGADPLRLSEILAEFTCTREVYTSGSGTSTAPASATFCIIKAWGGGGGGGAYDDSISQIGQNGGGGGFIYKQVAVTGGSTQIGYSVGAGGAGGTGDNPGADGGDTTLSNAVTLTAAGGKGGGGTAGAGGTTTGGDALSSNGSSNGNAGGQEFGGGTSANSGTGAGNYGGSSPFQNGSTGYNGKVILEYYTDARKKASALYRSGTYVPDNALNGTIPTSGTIELTDYLSTSSVGLGVDVNLVADVGSTFTGDCSTSISFNTDGTYDGSATIISGGSGSSTSGTFTGRKWASGFGAASVPTDYWIYAEVIGAGISLSGAATNTWLQLNSTRTWTNLATTGDDIWALRIKIAASSGGTVIDQMDVDLESLAAGIN